MSWDSYRKLDDNKEVNEDAQDYSWHLEHMPLLHSGFLETTKGRKPKSRLVLTLIFTRAKYVLKLTDRVSHKVAWIEHPPLENLFEWLEAEIKIGNIFWEIEEWDKPQGNSFS